MDGREASLTANDTGETIRSTPAFDATGLCGYADLERPCHASIAEVLVFSRAIDDDERRWIEQRLAPRYVLQLH